MAKYYCVKIDKRRKKAIENFQTFYKCYDISKCIENNEEAELAITEDFEIVSKL